MTGSPARLCTAIGRHAGSPTLAAGAVRRDKAIAVIEAGAHLVRRRSEAAQLDNGSEFPADPAPEAWVRDTHALTLGTDGSPIGVEDPLGGLVAEARKRLSPVAVEKLQHVRNLPARGARQCDLRRQHGSLAA